MYRVYDKAVSTEEGGGSRGLKPIKMFVRLVKRYKNVYKQLSDAFLVFSLPPIPPSNKILDAPLVSDNSYGSNKWVKIGGQMSLAVYTSSLTEENTLIIATIRFFILYSFQISYSRF